MMVSGLFSYFGFRFCQRLTHDAESRQLIDLYLESHSSESQTHDAEWSLQLEGWIVMSDTFWLKCPSCGRNTKKKYGKIPYLFTSRYTVIGARKNCPG